MYSLKNTRNPWKHILNDQVFTKSTTTTNFTVEKRMKRETKQKMNGVIYYLLTSFTAKRKKNKAMKSTKQNAVKADYHWLAIPICLAFKTVYYSAQHFLNFRQTTSLPPSQPSLATTTNLGYPHRKSKQQQTQQQQVHTERMEFGRGLNNWSCPALYRNY